MWRLSESLQNHYLVPIKYVCFYDFQPALTPPKTYPKRYPTNVSKWYNPLHQKLVFGVFLVAPSFCEVWGANLSQTRSKIRNKIEVQNEIPKLSVMKSKSWRPYIPELGRSPIHFGTLWGTLFGIYFLYMLGNIYWTLLDFVAFSFLIPFWTLSFTFVLILSLDVLTFL